MTRTRKPLKNGWKRIDYRRELLTKGAATIETLYEHETDVVSPYARKSDFVLGLLKPDAWVVTAPLECVAKAAFRVRFGTADENIVPVSREAMEAFIKAHDALEPEVQA